MKCGTKHNICAEDRKYFMHMLLKLLAIDSYSRSLLVALVVVEKSRSVIGELVLISSELAIKDGR